MSQKNAGSELSQSEASGIVGNTATESNEIESVDHTAPQRGIVSNLSESDKRVADELAKSAVDAYRSLALNYSLLPHSSVLDAMGKPFEPIRGSNLTEALTAQSQEDVKIVAIPASDFEKLSAKTAEILREKELAYERIIKDQAETELLKTETRAMLARLRAA